MKQQELLSGIGDETFVRVIGWLFETVFWASLAALFFGVMINGVLT